MDPYVNSLAPNSSLSMAQPRPVQSNQPQGPSHQEEKERQSDEFNRSVTIIIWYKANAQPIRLQQTVPAFPFFKLTSFQSLVADLGLSPASYLDTYIPSANQWEQHRIDTVRMVDSQQRLLYKVRRSLTDGLADEECLSLELELRSQRQISHAQVTPLIQSVDVQQPPTPNSPQNPSPPTTHSKRPSVSETSPKNVLKRTAQDDLRDANAVSKIHVSDGYYLAHTTSPSTSNNIIPESDPPIAGPSNHHINNEIAAPQSNNTQEQLPYAYQNTVFYANSSSSANTPSANDTLPHYLLSPQSPPAPIPYHPHPPLKRWPNDYTVSELSHGFHSMDLLIAQSPPGANMTQKTAFERVFGSRYVKSTVCRHRAVWRKAPPQLRQQFEAMGADDRACWGEFVRRVEGRPPGKHANHEIMTGSPSSALGFHDRQSTTDEDEMHNQDMSTMQNQVPPSTNTASMTNNITVYDPSRNHLAATTHTG